MHGATAAVIESGKPEMSIRIAFFCRFLVPTGGGGIIFFNTQTFFKGLSQNRRGDGVTLIGGALVIFKRFCQVFFGANTICI